MHAAFGIESKLNIKQLAELNEFRAELAAALVAAGGRCVEQMRMRQDKAKELLALVTICGGLIACQIPGGEAFMEYMIGPEEPTPHTIFEPVGYASGQEALAPNYMMQQQPLAEAASSEQPALLGSYTFEASASPTTPVFKNPDWLDKQKDINPFVTVKEAYWNEHAPRNIEEARAAVLAELYKHGYSAEMAERILKASVAIIINGRACSGTLVDNKLVTLDAFKSYITTSAHCGDTTAAFDGNNVRVISLYDGAALEGITSANLRNLYPDGTTKSADAAVLVASHSNKLPANMVALGQGALTNQTAPAFINAGEDACMVGALYRDNGANIYPVATCKLPNKSEINDKICDPNGKLECEDKGIYNFFNKQTIAGMSGSGLFTPSGQLIGVHVIAQNGHTAVYEVNDASDIDSVAAQTAIDLEQYLQLLSQQ